MVLFAKRRLLKAVTDGDDARLEALLAKGVDPDVTDADGDSALRLAALNRNERQVGLLIDAGAADKDGALEAAAFLGRDKMVRMLIERGAADRDGGALVAAASRDHFDIVRMLLDRFHYEFAPRARAEDAARAGESYDLLRDLGHHKSVLTTSEAARALLENGPGDEVSQTAFQWLRNHLGATVRVTRESRADGEYSPTATGSWRVARPFVHERNDHLMLLWRLDDLCSDGRPDRQRLTLPSSTYQEAEATTEALIYRYGFDVNSDGFDVAVGARHQVQKWVTFRFEL